jgi:hypothetical protein
MPHIVLTSPVSITEVEKALPAKVVTSSQTGVVLPFYVAPAPSGVVATDTTNLKTVIAEAIATGGTIRLGTGTYKINAALAFGALKGTNRAVTFEGAGAGNRFSGKLEGATIIQNESGGSAITGYGTFLAGESKPIVSLDLGRFIIENTSNIGANYTIDLDYVTQFGVLGEIYVEGNKHTGNGFRLRNTTNGGGAQSQILAHGFENGTGHYFAAEVTSNVETALNSGNSVHLNMQAIQCLLGVDIEGSTLFNSVASLCIKCVNETDIVGSIGIKHGEQAMQGTDISAHIERYATGVLENGARGGTFVSLLTSYPAGTPWLTTGSIEAGKKNLTVLDGTFWGEGDTIEIEGAGVAGATLVTKVTGGARTINLTIETAATTTVENKKITGVSAGVRYYNSAKNTTVINHRASGHHYAARFDGAASNEHTAWNAGLKTGLYSGEAIKKNIAIELTEQGRIGGGSEARRSAALSKGQKIITETCPKHGCNAFKETVSETAFGSAIGLCAGETVTGIALELENKPTELTLAKVGLTDKSGKVLAVSADQHTGWEGALGHKDIPFEATFTILEDDLYYLAVLTVVKGTKPKILCANSGLASAITNPTNGGKGVEVSAGALANLTGTIAWTTTASQLGLWLAVY